MTNVELESVNLWVNGHVRVCKWDAVYKFQCQEGFLWQLSYGLHLPKSVLLWV